MKAILWKTPRTVLLALFATGHPALAAGEGGPACNPTFLSGADRVVSSVAATCKSMNTMEPSVCQRALFERCTVSFTEVKRVRLSVCQNLKAEGDSIASQGFGNTNLSQAATQDSSTALSREAGASSSSISTLLRVEKEKLGALVRENQRVLALEACVKSTTFASYQGFSAKMNGDISAMQALLDSFSQRKKLDAQAAQQNAAVTTKNSAELNSMASGVSSGSSGGDSNLLPAALVAGGVGLGAMALMGGGGGHDLTSEGFPIPSTGGSPGTLDKFEGDAGKFIDENGVLVDPSFTDGEKSQIAQAIKIIPACHRPSLKGLRIQNDPKLAWQDRRYAGQCLPGKNINAGATILLNPTCYAGAINPGLVVHELIHRVARYGGMYEKYAETFHRAGRCPVSVYAKMNYSLREDFTEAARLAIFPASGNQNGASCVPPKVQKARQIMACP